MHFPVIFGFLFETPLAALLASAGAASVPIIIHLLNRNRYRIIPWAAMRFLHLAQKKNTKRMRLEQFLLLAVRTLVVLLLVLAMASVMPWAEAFWYRLFPDSAMLTSPGGRRTHKILVLDGSFSMALKTGDSTCFDRARDAAVQILQKGSGADGYSVVLMAAPPRRIVSEAADDARKVIEEVQSLRLPHGNADLGATLNAVEDMLRSSPGKFEEREIYFITDLQRSTWTARQLVDPTAALQKIQARARTIFVDVGQEGASNLAVTNLTLGVPLATTGSETPILATVHNFGPEPRKQVRVDLLVGKARKEAGDPPFQLREMFQSVVDISPGQAATVTLPHKFATPGEYVVQARLEPDNLELDNTRSAVVAVKETVPVMLVNGKPAEELFDRATEWLKAALNPFDSGLVPRNIPARPKVVTESQFADPGAGDLTGYDCVYLCDVARLGASEIRRLETHLRQGGGVVFCMGPRVDVEAYNRLLYRKGEGLLPARLIGQQRAPAGRFFTFYTEEDTYQRPPLEAFASDNDKLSLLGARFRQYLRLEMPPRSRARKILSFMPEAPAPGKPPVEAPLSEAMPSGDPAIVEWSRYRGKVVLVASTVNMDWTTWPVSPSYPAFMQELLRYAVSGRLREQAAVVGEALEESLPIGSADLEATLHLPDGRTESIRTLDREDASFLRWTDTDASGLYRVNIGKHPRDHLFAVNVPTTTESQQSCESDLTRTNQDELRATYPGWDFQVVTDPRRVVHTGGPTSDNAERGFRGMGTAVARWLLLGMLGLLLAEVVLAWHFGHYSAAAGLVEQTPGRGRVWPVLVAGATLAACGVLAGVLVHAAWTGDFLGFLPDNFRRAVEVSLDIPPPAPGEGVHWRLEFNPYFWDAASDPWLAGLLALGAAGLVVFLYLREGHTASVGYKVLLAGLRMSFVLLTLAVLLPQVKLWFERQGWPDLALIIDDSRSMSERDQYQDPRVKEAAQKLAAIDSLTDPQRLQLAQALLTRTKPDWLETLLTRRKVKVHVYHCSGRASRLRDVTDDSDPEQKAAALRAIQELRAEGDSSQLGTCLRQVLNDFRGSSLATVIMLTDGVTTEGEDLVKAASYAAQTHVPLYFVGIGDSREVRELKLHDVQVDDTVYVNDRVIFEARLTGHGLQGVTVPVTLKEKGKDKELDRKYIKIDASGKPQKVRLVDKPTEPGEKVYILDVPPQPGESPSAGSHTIERTVFVREAKLNKVLYVEGSARYEYRYIKHLLERESAKDPRNKSIDLKVLLLDADDEYARQDKSALSDFPSKVELYQFDLIIFGDVDPRDRRVDKNLKDVAEFVRERGGGFLMIAGEHYSPFAYRNTPLRDILPIEVQGPEPAESDRATTYRPELTPRGRFHPIFRFDPDEASNNITWNGLPGLYWWSECYRTKPAAEVLAVHPRQRTDNGEPYPLVVQQFVGAGRSMFFGFNETWRWRYRDNELHFNQFWIQTVRYLARTRLGRIQLRLDRQPPFRRGESIKITVTFPDDAPPPPPETEVKVFAERRLTVPGGEPETEGQTLTLAKVEGSRATFETLFTRTPEGEYRFWLTSPTVTGAKPRAECQVMPPPGEMDRLRMNQADMERAADETKGHFYTLADAEQLLEDLPSGNRVSLNAPQPPRLMWNLVPVFALALGLLSTEWFLRKRKHLL